MKTLKDNDELSLLLPSSIKKDENVKNITQALNPCLIRLYEHLHDALFLYRLNKLNSEQLDHIASQFNLYVWRDTWALEYKRRVLSTCIRTISRYGTKSAITDVLSAIGGGVTIKEWFQSQPAEKAHTFSITVDLNVHEGNLESEQIDDVLKALNQVKPVRAQYTFSQYIKFENSIKIYPASRQISFTRCSSPAPNRYFSTIYLKNYPASRQISFTRLTNKE